MCLDYLQLRFYVKVAIYGIYSNDGIRGREFVCLLRFRNIGGGGNQGGAFDERFGKVNLSSGDVELLRQAKLIAARPVK